MNQADTSSTSLAAFINYIAVTSVTTPGRILSKAILHVMCLPQQSRQTTTEIQAALLNRFSFEVPLHEVETTLRDLANDGRVIRLADNVYELDAAAVASRRERITDAKWLEEVVRTEWINEVNTSFPSLQTDILWESMLEYLGAALRRHGVQSAAFLYPDLVFPPDAALSDSLTELLRASVERFPEEERSVAATAISDFLTHAHDSEHRRHWIAQLADGAVNYFAVTAPPEASRVVRRHIEQFTLFLDTNFLFGILDLHANPQISASKDLIKLKTNLKLPLVLTYHPATEAEMEDTINHYAEKLRRRDWSPILSRAALQSKDLSGIERKYHTLNAQTPIPVEAFLRVYTRPDLLLPKQNISRARTVPNVETAKLFERYGEYLERVKGAGKSWSRTPATMQHDVTILATILAIRERARSKADAHKTWLLTCDYHLYRFDLEIARADGREPCTLLPNVLWQALRASVADRPEFDKSFAAAFAIPEFRTIGSAASAACSQVLAYLATTANLDEAVAARVLSNSMLIDRVRGQSYDDVKSQIDAAIEAEEDSLLELHAAVAKKAADDQTAHAALQRTVSHQNRELEQLQRRLAELEIAEVSRKTADLERALKEQKIARRLQLLGYVGGSIVAAAASFLVSQIATYFQVRWYIDHPNRLPMILIVALFVFSGVNYVINTNWRRREWATAVFLGLALTILSILGGGPSQTSSESHNADVGGGDSNRRTAARPQARTGSVAPAAMTPPRK